MLFILRIYYKRLRLYMFSLYFFDNNSLAVFFYEKLISIQTKRKKSKGKKFGKIKMKKRKKN